MLRDALKKVVGGENLDERAVREAFDIIMEQKAPPAQVGAFLTVLRMRGETAEEIAGAASALRDRCVRLPGEDLEDALDTCGTGGDGAGTVNISTLAALVAAGAGARVAKHGNRSVSSRCGSADLLRELGVKVDPPPDVAARCLREAGFAFLFAPLYHPAMKAVGPIRQDLGIRTLFNLIGPLCNPAGVRRQLMGVYSVDLVPVIAGVLTRLGCKRGVVVASQDGLDEISVCAPTTIAEIGVGPETVVRIIEPETFGLSRRPPGALRGGTPAENAAVSLELLGGARGPVRDAVVLNAAAALEVAGIAADIPEGMARAEAAIDSGAATRVLERIRQITQETAA